MNLLCIDPGPETSGVVIFNGEEVSFIDSKAENDLLARRIRNGYFQYTDHLAIEMIASFGMAVGESTFETVFWTGRFCEAFNGDFTKVFRREVKLHLCNSMRAKDANIRRAVLDKFPKTGGGKTPEIGTKKAPGPLYGVSSHAFPALAVGITWFETQREAA